MYIDIVERGAGRSKHKLYLNHYLNAAEHYGKSAVCCQLLRKKWKDRTPRYVVSRKREAEGERDIYLDWALLYIKADIESLGGIIKELIEITMPKVKMSYGKGTELTKPTPEAILKKCRELDACIDQLNLGGHLKHAEVYQQRGVGPEGVVRATESLHNVPKDPKRYLEHVQGRVKERLDTLNSRLICFRKGRARRVKQRVPKSKEPKSYIFPKLTPKNRRIKKRVDELYNEVQRLLREQIKINPIS
ncbi:MAG: hypothetical protein ABIG20_02735 [archaeon]